MRQLVLASAIVGAFVGPALADDRFVEFPSDTGMTTFDLSTVSLVQPGKFSVIYTTISSPDTIRLTLAIYEDLKAACGKAPGEYDISPKVLAQKKPDLPVEKVKVTGKGNEKMAMWSKPYYEDSRTRNGAVEQVKEVLPCNPKFQSLDDYYKDVRQVTLGGLRSKIMFDCRRGVMGVYPRDTDAAPMGLMEIRGGYVTYYKKVCPKVTGEPPYLP